VACSCLASVGNAGFSAILLKSSHYSCYTSKGNQVLALIIDLLHPNSALESVGSSLGAADSR